MSRLGRVPWRRLLRLTLVVVGGVLMAYWVAANVLLRTRLLRATINGSSASFTLGDHSSAVRLEYRSAYSWLPGRVHVEGLMMRGRDETVEWSFSLDHADVVISLPGLLQRTFHATRVRAGGFAIQARLRLEPEEATPRVVAALPTIAGFADPPLVSGTSEPPPPPEAKDDSWAVNLEDVDVEHAREVWIHTIRARGDTRVRGRWLFHPGRWLDVGPAIVDVNGVDFSYGSESLAKGVRGSARATVHPFDLRQVRGLATFDHVSYDGKLHGVATLAGALRLLIHGGLSFKMCDLPFDSRFVLVHGRVALGTQLKTEAASCGVEGRGLAVEGPVRSDLSVAGDLATLHAAVSDLRAFHDGTELAHVTSIATTLTSGRLQLTHFLTDTSFNVDVAGAATSDIGAWHDFFPTALPFVIRSGSVTGGGHADGSLAEERGQATLELLARRLGIERDQGRVTADAAVFRINLRRAALKERIFDLSGSDIALRDVSAAYSPSKAAFLAIPSLAATAPRLVVSPTGTDGHVAIDVPRINLLDLRRLNGLLPSSKNIRVESGTGRAKVRADVELASGAIRGDAELAARRVRVAVESTRFLGDFTAKVRAQRAGGAAGSTDFSGSTLALSNVATATSPTADWWGALTLKHATLQTSGSPRFDASVQLRAKDASPATAVVAQNSGVPAWAANIFRMPALSAHAEMSIRPSSVEVRSLVAHGAGGASLRAEYAKRAGRQDGALLLDLGWIGLGYDLADGATGFVLLGPESWYGRKVAIMRGAATGRERTSDARQLARYSSWSLAERQSEARELAAQCARALRTCDDGSIDNLLRSSRDPAERGALGGTIYAPLLEAAARRGTDGATLDPLVVGSSAEALKLGGGATLDHVSTGLRAVAVRDADSARGRVIAVTGSVSSLRPEGSYFVGTLRSDEGPVYFITPFAVGGETEGLRHFRGVFVQWYGSPNLLASQSAALVLVGEFTP